jgi:RNA polymerase sigma factor (sigma-70 family)
MHTEATDRLPDPGSPDELWYNEARAQALWEHRRAMANEEQRLVEAAQRGNVEAFNQLVRLYEGRVYNLCYRMLGDADAAADVAQDSFISAYKNLQKFRGGVFRSWLLRIATNACYDALRARKRRPTVSIEAGQEGDDDGPAFDIPDAGESPDEAALRKELADAIHRGIAELPEEQRVVVILSDLQGLAYEEIALVTNTNLGTVKSRLSRARARLRDTLRAGELLPSKFRLDDV